MIRKALFLFAVLMVVTVVANVSADQAVFTDAPMTPAASWLSQDVDTSRGAMSRSTLRVSITGCFSSGLGDYLCSATVTGGSGSYNYFWQYTGAGSLFQTNSPWVTITGCTFGTGTLQLSVRDRVTFATGTSSVYFLSC